MTPDDYQGRTPEQVEKSALAAAISFGLMLVVTVIALIVKLLGG